MYTTRQVAADAHDQYARMIGNKVNLFLFENTVDGHLSCGVVCPRGSVLAAPAPIPFVSLEETDNWIRNQLLN